MILLIDNYDSFVHNLARYLRRLGQRTVVLRNDVLTVAEIRRLAPRAIVLSPGPGTPHQAGVSLQIVRDLYQQFPLLGVCLGHQTIAAALGAEIARAAEPMHGRNSFIEHDQTPLFRDIPSPCQVCRYHSLVVRPSSVPPHLRVTARTTDGTIMALEHTYLPVAGVQFHPEAILTQFGLQLLANFLRLAGISTRGDLDAMSRDELQLPPEATYQPPLGPVTF